ncbi:MAG TPA: peptidylprolyl isomerase [Alphaproteobacteria bacterium]|nr:peptidylprolyl isomerase [Alphaproteobacteria bacterium]
MSMTVVSVNGRAISGAEVAAELQNHPAEAPEAAWRDAVEALVVRELLLQEARGLGLAPQPQGDAAGRRETDEDALVRQLLEREIRVPEADTESCRRYYENNRSRFRSPDLFEAAHILLSAHPDDADAYAAATAEAEAILARLQMQPGLFAELAQTRSDCSSGQQGGTLGQVSRGQTVPEFETFLFSLEEGQLCPVPVKSRYGVHVLRLDRRIDGRELPFEMAEPRIAAYLREASWRRAVAQYIRLLVGRAAIEGLDLAGADSPLVQ